MNRRTTEAVGWAKKEAEAENTALRSVNKGDEEQLKRLVDKNAALIDRLVAEHQEREVDSQKAEARIGALEAQVKGAATGASGELVWMTREEARRQEVRIEALRDYQLAADTISGHASEKYSHASDGSCCRRSLEQIAALAGDGRSDG